MKHGTNAVHVCVCRSALRRYTPGSPLNSKPPEGGGLGVLGVVVVVVVTTTTTTTNVTLELVNENSVTLWYRRGTVNGGGCVA
jgi:hypothetical protein